MKTSKILLLSASVALLAACTNVERSRTLSNPDVDGKTFAKQVCSACHGVDGNSISPEFPKLSAQQPDYIVAQIDNIRAHNRTDRFSQEIMYGLIHPLTPKQETEIAEYFSSQKPVNINHVDAMAAQAGKDIFENGVPDRGVVPCQICHAPDAAGMGPMPRLAGQHEHYIVKQLHVFRDTQGRPGTPMEDVAKNLTDQDMANVAAYLAGL